MEKEFDSCEFELLCRRERRRIKTLELNDQYSQRIWYQDREYHYDPDYDCFYAHVPWSEQSLWDRWGWISVTLALTVVCWLLA